MKNDEGINSYQEGNKEKYVSTYYSDKIIAVSSKSIPKNKKKLHLTIVPPFNTKEKKYLNLNI